MPGKISRENGKKGGRPLGAVSEETKKKQILEKYLADQVIAKKEKIIKSLIHSAIKGNVQAIKEILDRVVGKTTQNIDVNSEGFPIQFIVKKQENDKAM